MSVAWTLVGEAGKALDATPRTLAEIRAQDVFVRFANGKPDYLSFRVPMPNIDGTGIIAPELEQEVSFWHDATRYFIGHCVRRRPRFNGASWWMDIQVSGAWWWLDQIPLTSTQADQAGTDATRIAFVFGTGDLATSFGALATRAITLGAPITAGTVATMFDIPRITVTSSSLAAGFLELQRWVPDSMLAFDYSGAGDPVLKVTRRKTGLAAGSAATRTITMGVDPVTEIDLQPMIELEVRSVTIDSVDRDSQGRAIWQTQTSGAPAAAHTQIVSVSGPEAVDTTLPPDFFESVEVRSKLIKPSGVITGEIFEIYDDRIKAAGATGLAMGAKTVNLFGGGTYVLPAVATAVTLKEGGALPAPLARFLSVGEPKDWWTRDGIPWAWARATATLHMSIVSPSPIPNGYSANPPDWVEALGMDHVALFEKNATGSGYHQIDIYWTTSAVLFPAVGVAWNTLTTLWRKEDYSYVNPPAGLAANLLAAQDFIPYSGTVSLVHEDIPAGNPVGTCINIADGPPELAAVRALVQAAEMDIDNGIETLFCGASPRLAYQDLVRRFRRTGYEVIDYIANPGLNPT
jgi:hypothetical protein